VIYAGKPVCGGIVGWCAGGRLKPAALTKAKLSIVLHHENSCFEPSDKAWTTKPAARKVVPIWERFSKQSCIATHEIN
jgi:dienelactone hydrolase